MDENLIELGRLIEAILQPLTGRIDRLQERLDAVEERLRIEQELGTQSNERIDRVLHSKVEDDRTVWQVQYGDRVKLVDTLQDAINFLESVRGKLGSVGRIHLEYLTDNPGGLINIVEQRGFYSSGGGGWSIQRLDPKGRSTESAVQESEVENDRTVWQVATKDQAIWVNSYREALDAAKGLDCLKDDEPERIDRLIAMPHLERILIIGHSFNIQC